MKVLAVNKHPLRGSLESVPDDDEQDLSAGLFLKLFKYTLAKGPKLKEMTKTIPPNAKYTPKTIQNEVTEALANSVLTDIKNHARFSIKSDGTRRRCNVENPSVIIRFVCDGIPDEHLIGLLDLSQLDAEYITTQILNHLSDSGYCDDQIVGQCCD